MKKLLYKYHLKITTLSPVHIGASEQYEPTSFVIDKGIFYKFDETIFYKSLSTEDKKAIENKMSNYLQIIEFYKTKKSEAKKISHFTCKVSKEIEGKYSAKNPNKLQIDTTFKNPNTLRAIIPGSSIKGVLDTILHIYSAPEISSNEERQKVVVSDALLLDGGVEIGYSRRKHRYKKENGKGIPQMVEVIKPNSTFILSIDSDKKFDEIKAHAKRYYEKRGFYKENGISFVLRIGRYCGKEYMVDNMQNLKNSYGKPLATRSLYFSDQLQDKPFGWLKIEPMKSDTFKEDIKTIASQEEEYRKCKNEKHISILNTLEREREEQRKKIEAIKKAEKEKLEKQIIAEARREAKLAKMSPVERIIDSYADLASLINDMKADKIENFAEIKVELATKIKAELQKNPKTWERAKRKALERKEYIESLLNS